MIQQINFLTLFTLLYVAIVIITTVYTIIKEGYSPAFAIFVGAIWPAYFIVYGLLILINWADERKQLHKTKEKGREYAESLKIKIQTSNTVRRRKRKIKSPQIIHDESSGDQYINME